jgi:predicted nucleic acid-binding protein
MKAECVLDASVVARFWFCEEDSPGADAASALLRAHAAGDLLIHAPDLLFPEVASALWKMVRFRGWPGAAARTATAQLVDLGLVAHPSSGIVGDALGLALDLGVTVYDAMYGALAFRLSLPLFTGDRRLARALAGSVEVRSILPA